MSLSSLIFQSKDQVFAKSVVFMTDHQIHILFKEKDYFECNIAGTSVHLMGIYNLKQPIQNHSTNLVTFVIE